MGLFAQIKKGEKRMLQNTSAGLSEAEAKARLAKVGENRLRGKKGASVAAMFFSQFKDLMILIIISDVDSGTKNDLTVIRLHKTVDDL